MYQIKLLVYTIFYLLIATSISQAKIHVNQIGYDKNSPKTAVIQLSSASSFASWTLKTADGINIESGILTSAMPVSGWNNRWFQVINFSNVTDTGSYYLQAGQEISHTFMIGEHLLLDKTLNACIKYFNDMRCRIDDSCVPLLNSTTTVDMNGGWRDASGDPGKHFSHLSYAAYFNPQQIPLVVWALLKTIQRNSDQISDKNAIENEAAYGADYLVKSLSAEGYFYASVFDGWGFEARNICEWGQNGVRNNSWQAGMREGAGIAISALAISSRLSIAKGNNSPTDYLNAAEKAYVHLKTNNINYINDGNENIIDYYCGLSAAIELYKATNKSNYLTDAEDFATNLIALLTNDGYFHVDSGSDRPYYHAVEEGLPILILCDYHAIAPNKTTVENALTVIVNNYMQITNEVVNPFNYARMHTASVDYGTNIAFNKDAVASSTESSEYTAMMAVDGNSTTRWASDVGNPTEWLSIDLGSEKRISRVIVKWEAAYAEQYLVQLSLDNISWRNVASMSWSNGGEDMLTFDPTNARYVRIYGEKKGVEQWGYSIYEIEIYETANTSSVKTSFFMPHDNETGYWWQGENSRIASLSAAVLMAASILNSSTKLNIDSILTFATSQIDWILGKNPFDVCMLHGYGETGYPNYPAKYGIQNINGGICNGITSGRIDENDIEFVDDISSADSSLTWRWIEQWIPHTAWYLTAIGVIDSFIYNPTSVVITKQITTKAPDFRINKLKMASTISLDIYLNSANTGTISIFDIRGRTLYKKNLTTKDSHIIIPVSNLGTNVLFIRVSSKNSTIIKSCLIGKN